jgi:hypothetical protein
MSKSATRNQHIPVSGSARNVRAMAAIFIRQRSLSNGCL